MNRIDKDQCWKIFIINKPIRGFSVVECLMGNDRLVGDLLRG